MDKKHTCDFCNKTYASASSKSTHIKKFHKNTEEKEIPVEKVIEEIPIEKEIPVEKKKVQKKKIKVEEKVKPVEKVIEEILNYKNHSSTVEVGIIGMEYANNGTFKYYLQYITYHNIMYSNYIDIYK